MTVTEFQRPDDCTESWERQSVISKCKSNLNKFPHPPTPTCRGRWTLRAAWWRPCVSPLPGPGSCSWRRWGRTSAGTWRSCRRPAQPPTCGRGSPIPTDLMLKMKKNTKMIWNENTLFPFSFTCSAFLVLNDKFIFKFKLSAGASKLWFDQIHYEGRHLKRHTSYLTALTLFGKYQNLSYLLTQNWEHNWIFISFLDSIYLK